jgi:hypothetical protein
MEYAVVDHGAYGGVCGDDMFVVEGTECLIDVSGLVSCGTQG